MCLARRIFGVVLAAVIFAAPVRAELLDLGTVTRDTESGLDWLDWTETNGFSATSVLAGNGGFLADRNLSTTLRHSFSLFREQFLLSLTLRVG